MKDEFTTAMHADMLGWSQEDSVLIEVWTKIHKGMSKENACIKAGITMEYYEANIEQAWKRCF